MPELTVDACRCLAAPRLRGLLARTTLACAAVLTGLLAVPAAQAATTLVAEFEGRTVQASLLVAQNQVAVVQADPSLPAESLVTGRFELSASGVDLDPDLGEGLFAVDAQIDLQIGGQTRSLSQSMHLSLGSSLAGDLLQLRSLVLPGFHDELTLALALEPGALDLDTLPTSLLGAVLLDRATQSLLGQDSSAFQGTTNAVGKPDGTLLGQSVTFQLTGLTGFPAPVASPVPEPATALCLALGLVGMAGRQRIRARPVAG